MFEEFKNIFKSKNFIAQIIVINAIVFVVINLLENILFKGNAVIANWFALPSGLNTFVWRPWTLITYMFLHANLSHLIYNLLVFYWFARIFNDFMGNDRLFGLYMMGGLSGGVFFLLVYNVMFLAGEPIGANVLVGASAAVMAVVVATAFKFPTYQINLLFLGPVQIRWVAVFIFVVSTVLDLGDNFGGKMAHLGGAAFGFAYIRGLNNGRDYTRIFHLLKNAVTNLFKPRPKMRVSHSQPAQATARPTDINPKEAQRRIDAILDKISKSGYDNLSKEEKAFLFKYSNKKN